MITAGRGCVKVLLQQAGKSIAAKGAEKAKDQPRKGTKNTIKLTGLTRLNHGGKVLKSSFSFNLVNHVNHV
jgi:hypothetical protein